MYIKKILRHIRTKYLPCKINNYLDYLILDVNVWHANRMGNNLLSSVAYRSVLYVYMDSQIFTHKIRHTQITTYN